MVDKAKKSVHPARSANSYKFSLPPDDRLRYKGLSLLCSIAIGLILWSLVPLFFSERFSPIGSKQAWLLSDNLQDRINPNVAGVFSLARLKGIGPARASAIVEYRDNYRHRHGSAAIAFVSAQEMCRVKGIGPAISAAIEPYLIFGTPLGPDAVDAK